MKTKLTLLALSLSLPVLAAVPAGTWETANGDFEAGDWAQVLDQGIDGGIGNEWQLIGASYALTGALITETTVAETGVDFERTLSACSGGILTLANTEGAPWFVETDPAASFTVTLDSVTVNTWRFTATGEIEFTVTAEGTTGDSPARTVVFTAGYTGQPIVEIADPPFMLGNLDWAALTVTVPILPLTVDIKPGSSVNPVNLTSRGVVPVAIMGSAEVDVSLIDPATIRLEGVAPARFSIGDMDLDGDEATLAGDGYPDLKMKFKTTQLAAALGAVTRNETRELTLTASLFDGTLVGGTDTIRILKGNGHKPKK